MLQFTRQFVLGVVLIAAAVGTACGGSDTSPTPARDYSGNWSGTTAQGRPISFRVSGNTVTTVSAGYTVQGRFQNSTGSGICTADGTSSATPTTPPITISGNGFQYAGSVISALAGSFSSATAASGTATFTISSSSCAGTVSTTWTATKQ